MSLNACSQDGGRELSALALIERLYFTPGSGMDGVFWAITMAWMDMNKRRQLEDGDKDGSAFEEPLCSMLTYMGADREFFDLCRKWLMTSERDRHPA